MKMKFNLFLLFLATLLAASSADVFQIELDDSNQFLMATYSYGPIILRERYGTVWKNVIHSDGTVEILVNDGDLMNQAVTYNGPGKEITVNPRNTATRDQRWKFVNKSGPYVAIQSAVDPNEYINPGPSGDVIAGVDPSPQWQLMLPSK